MCYLNEGCVGHVIPHRLVGLLLARMLGGSTRIGPHLHMHGIDDVEEVLHHRHSLQGAVLGRAAI